MNDFVATPAHGAAWITGASSGIGRAVALALARKGFTVCVTARNEQSLIALAEEAKTSGGKIIPMAGDVTSSEDMDHIVTSIMAHHKALALVIFNAGIYLPVDVAHMKVETFQQTFDVNLTGVVNGLVPAIDAMKQAGRGQIAIVSSVTGYGGLPTSSAYGATKAALINMAESLKFDLDKLGIRIQIINPGFVDTPATENNAFTMPALISVDEAAQSIMAGLRRNGFEITFPRRFTYVLKALQFLPYRAYFAVINRATGWKNRPVDGGSSAQSAP